jgi:hypothetical protein
MAHKDKWKSRKSSPPFMLGEPGTYGAGIRNAEMLELFGVIMSDWVHIEEAMIEVMNLLVFVDFDIQRLAASRGNGFLPGRQIFRSMRANGVRAKMMLNLLNQYPGNATKDELCDDIIKEFQRLVNLRNDYAHGLWWTKEDGRVFLQTENIDVMSFNRKKHIPKSQFESFNQRAGKLMRDIEALQLKDYRRSTERKEELERLRASHPKPA